MKQKLIYTALCLFLLVGTPAQTAFASEEWPSDISIEADAGIVMDADSGTILYGKNIHDTYSPASITKVLTAIIILENCDLDEEITFSKNAVYNVEADSSSAGYDTGDKATVKDCLYALLLKSANESANALAEHAAGTTEAFAEMMNEKAAELGCVDSHFSNPSGLNDENHYVSAYDMALITRYAFENETFREIVSTPYYKLPPNGRNPEGLGISPGNKMIKKNFPEYRADVIGGKTGYTSIALNTLVIGAAQEDTQLITVVLHSHGTTYSDTKRMLDFGFDNFRSVPLENNDTTWGTLSNNLTIAGLPTSSAPALTVDPDSRIILPNSAEFSETTSSVSFDLPESAPAHAIAAVRYSLGEREVGTAWLTLGTQSEMGKVAIPEALLDIAPTSIAQVSFENSENSKGKKGKEIKESNAPNEADSQTLNTSEESKALKKNDNTSQTDQKEASDSEKKSIENAPNPDSHSSKTDWTKLPIPRSALILSLSVAVIAGLLLSSFLWIKAKKRKEEAERLERRKKRLARLKESGVSEDEFNEMMENRRLSIPLKPDHRPARKQKHSGSLLAPQKNKQKNLRSQKKGFTLKKKKHWKW